MTATNAWDGGPIEEEAHVGAATVTRPRRVLLVSVFGEEQTVEIADQGDRWVVVTRRGPEGEALRSKVVIAGGVALPATVAAMVAEAVVEMMGGVGETAAGAAERCDSGGAARIASVGG